MIPSFCRVGCVGLYGVKKFSAMFGCVEGRSLVLCGKEAIARA